MFRLRFDYLQGFCFLNLDILGPGFGRLLGSLGLLGFDSQIPWYTAPAGP